MKALLGLCDLPLEKRTIITQALVLDETIDSPEHFCFVSLPDSQAPTIFVRPIGKPRPS